MKSFNDKVAVITGAASGIGAALAVELAERGCRLAISDIDESGLDETSRRVATIGADCSQHIVDVSDRTGMEKLAVDVNAHHGGVDLIINNAGVTLVDTVSEASWEDLEWIMNVNFWGVVHGSKAFLPYLRQSEDAHIVNISSVFGLMSVPTQSAYNASKFAVRGLTEALKMELAGTSINVSSVHPGAVLTRIVENARVNEEAIGASKERLVKAFARRAKTTSEEAATTIIRGIQKNKRRIIVGRDARIGDWLARLFPGSYEKIMGLEKAVRARARSRSTR